MNMTREMYLENQKRINARIGNSCYWLEDAVVDCDEACWETLLAWYDGWLTDMDEIYGDDAAIDGLLDYEHRKIIRAGMYWGIGLRSLLEAHAKRK